MDYNRSFTLEGIPALIGLGVVIAAFYGWINNAYRLTKADFEPSYKTEIIRTAGVIIVPAGIILGYIDIPDNKKVASATQLNK